MGDTSKLYGVLVDQGLYTKSQQEFDAKYSDPDNQQLLYDVVQKEGLYTKSMDEFTAKYFDVDVKKKDSSEFGFGESRSDTSDTKPDGSSESSTQSDNFFESYKDEIPVAKKEGPESVIDFDPESYDKNEAYLKETEEEFNNLHSMARTLTDPKDNIQLLSSEETKRYKELYSARVDSEAVIAKQAKNKALYEYEQSVVGTEYHDEFLKNIADDKALEAADDDTFTGWMSRSLSYLSFSPLGGSNKAKMKQVSLDAMRDQKLEDLKKGTKEAKAEANKAYDRYQQNVDFTNERIEEVVSQYKSGSIKKNVAETKINYLLASNETKRTKILEESDKLNKYAVGLEYMSVATSFENLGTIEATVKGGSNQLARLPRQAASLLTAITAPALATINWATFGLAGTDYNQTVEAMMPMYEFMSGLTEDMTFRTDPDKYMANLTGETLVQLGEIVGVSMVAGPQGALALTAAMTHDEMFSDLMQNSELTTGEANELASAYALVAAPMEMIGARLGVEAFVTKGLKHNLISLAKKELFQGGGSVLEKVQKVLAPTFQQLLRASGVEALEEGTTEAVQTMTQEGIKEIQNKLDQYRMGDDYTPRIRLMEKKEFIDTVIESFLSGAYAGFLFGGVSSISNLGGTKSKFIGQSLADGKTYESLREIAKSKLDNGSFTEDQYNTVMLNMSDARHAYTTTTLIKNKNIRDEVMALSLQRSQVERLQENNETKKPLLKNINASIAVLMEEAQAETTGSISAQETFSKLKGKYASVDNMVKMISENQHVVEETTKDNDGKDVKKTVANPKYKEASANAVVDLDKEIALLEASDKVEDKQALNDLYDIRRNITDKGGSNFTPKSLLKTDKYTIEEQKRSATYGKVADVLQKADENEGVVTKEVVDEIKKVIKADGYNPNVILDINQLEGKTVNEVALAMEESRSDFGTISAEHRRFNDVQSVAARTGVESGIVAGLQKYAVDKLKYSQKEASDFSVVGSRFLAQIAASSKKSKKEVYDSFMKDNVGINQHTVNEFSMIPTVEPLTHKDTKEQMEKFAKLEKDYRADIESKFMQDGKGNYVFKHYSTEQRDVLDPAFSGKNNIISREEKAAMSSAGGFIMFYTEEGHGEFGVGDSEHTVTVPKDKVYIFNSDKDGLYYEAKQRFKEQFPNQAFTPNHQLAWITKVANSKGYQMVVSIWGNHSETRWRAQSAVKMVPNESKLRTDAGKVFKASTGRGNINPLVQMIEVYQEYMPVEDKAAVLAWNKDKEWTQNTSRRFVKNFLNYLELGENEDSSINEALSNLKSFMGKTFSSKGSKLSNPMKNLMAKVTGDFTREGRIKEAETKVNLKKNKTKQDEYRVILEERVSVVREKVWANSVRSNLPESRFKTQEEFEKTIKDGTWAMLTGENPDAMKNITSDRNKKLNKKAEKWLRGKGYSPVSIYGMYDGSENPEGGERSFFVEGITQKHAAEFAKEFDQQSVAHSDGFVYKDGSTDPRVRGTEDFNSNPTDFFSSININGKVVDFEVEYQIRSGSNNVTQKEVLLVDSEKRKQALSRLTIEDTNNIRALELANIDLVSLNSLKPKAATHITEALDRFINDNNIDGLSSKDPNTPMDLYIAYNRLNKANLGGMTTHKNLKVDSGVTRAFMSIFADTQTILRSALSNLSTQDVLEVMDAIGFNRYSQGVARSMTDIENASEVIEEITTFLEDNKLSDVDANKTQVFMAEVTFAAKLLSPNTTAVDDLNGWYDDVLTSITNHKNTLIVRGKNNLNNKNVGSDLAIEKENKNSREGSSNVYDVLHRIKTEMELEELDISENWDVVKDKLKEKLPKHMELIGLTASMHRIHGDEVLNYKRRIGDLDTYAGDFYNSFSVRNTNGDELGLTEKTDYFGSIVDSTGSLEDRTESKVAEGRYTPTWAYIATQQRAYNLSSRLMFTGEAIRQMDHATKTNARSFAGLSGSLTEQIGEKQIELVRGKIRSMVNFSAAADEIRMFTSTSSGTDRFLKNSISRVAMLKNQLLMSMKQPLVQASVASFAIATMPFAFFSTIADMKNRTYTNSMMSIISEQSSLGARNASYFIKSTTSSSKDIIGGAAGTVINRVAGNAGQSLQEALLSKPDLAIATTAWLAAYKDKMIDKLGKEKFNWDKEAANPDREAINYAEMMQQSSQASNVKEAGSEFSTSSNELWSLTRELVFPFKFFDNSFRTNLLTDLSMMKHDAQAWKRILGYSTIPVAYASVKWAARVKMVQMASGVVNALMGAFDDDDDDKNAEGSYLLRLMKSTLETQNKRLNTNETLAEYIGEQFISDFAIGWLPYVGTFEEIRRPAMYYGINMLDYNFGSSEFHDAEGDVTDLDNKELYRTFDEFVRSDAPAFQIFNGGKNFEYIAPPVAIFVRGVEAAKMWNDGYMDLKGGGRYYLSDDDKETAKNMAIFDFATIFLSPLQELRQVAALSHKDLLNMHKGYKFEDHADKGEFTDQWNYDMYLRYVKERSEIAPNKAKQFGSSTQQLMLRSMERDMGIGNVQYNKLVRESQGVLDKLTKKGFNAYTLPMAYEKDDAKERLMGMNKDFKD